MHIDLFLRARVDDDERHARDALRRVGTEDSRLSVTAEGLVRETGWRALAEVALQREVLFSHHDEPRRRGRDWVVECITCDEPYPCQTLRIAVAVYRDHPQYETHWRPHDPDLR